MPQKLQRINYHTIFLIAVFGLLSFSWLEIVDYLRGTAPAKGGWEDVFSLEGTSQVLRKLTLGMEIGDVCFLLVCLFLFFSLLCRWLKEPTIFKASLIVASSPLWGFIAEVTFGGIVYSLIWFCFFLSVGIAWKFGCYVYRHWPNIYNFMNDRT